MERITPQLIDQAKKNFLQPLQTELPTHKNDKEISVYFGETVKPEVIAGETAKILVSFPSLDKLFFTVLTERLIKNNFTEQRLKDAVGYLLDNFHYQKPTIADIINFDKKIKLYSYHDVVFIITKNEARFEDFYKHWIGDTLYWVKKSEVEMWNLTNYLNENSSIK